MLKHKSYGSSVTQANGASLEVSILSEALCVSPPQSEFEGLVQVSDLGWSCVPDQETTWSAMRHTSSAVDGAVQRRLLMHTARDIGPQTFEAFDDESLSDNIGKARKTKQRNYRSSVSASRPWRYESEINLSAVLNTLR